MSDQSDKPLYWSGANDPYRAEHVSDNVFPILNKDGDMPQPHRLEWQDVDAYVKLACGCSVPIEFGDTLWFIVTESGFTVPIAVDPVTIH